MKWCTCIMPQQNLLPVVSLTFEWNVKVISWPQCHKSVGYLTHMSNIKTARIIWLQVLVLIVLKKGLRWYEAPVDITIMWIKVHYNYFHCFKILQYLTKPCFKIFWKGKFIKAPAAFIIVTYRKVVIYKALTHCAMMLGNNFWRENYYKIMIDFIVYFDIKCVRIRMCVLYHLTMVEESTINLFFLLSEITDK